MVLHRIFLRGSAVTSPYAAYSILAITQAQVRCAAQSLRGTSVQCDGVYHPKYATHCTLAPATMGLKLKSSWGRSQWVTQLFRVPLKLPENASDSGVAVGNYYSYSATGRLMEMFYPDGGVGRALSDTELVVDFW